MYNCFNFCVDVQLVKISKLSLFYGIKGRFAKLSTSSCLIEVTLFLMFATVFFSRNVTLDICILLACIKRNR